MCAATVRCLQRFDWRNRIEWKAMQDIASPPPGITREDLDRSAYLVCAPGENYEGFFGFRKMFMAMPLLFPLGALMWVPGVHLIGVSTYRLVADNRHRISRCGLPGWRVDGVDQRGDLSARSATRRKAGAGVRNPRSSRGSRVRLGQGPTPCQQVRILNSLIIMFRCFLNTQHTPHTRCSRLRGHGRAAYFTLSARLVVARAGVGCRGAVSDQVLAGRRGWARLGSPVDGGAGFGILAARGVRGVRLQLNPTRITRLPSLLPRLDALDGRQGPGRRPGAECPAARRWRRQHLARQVGNGEIGPPPADRTTAGR